MARYGLCFSLAQWPGSKEETVGSRHFWIDGNPAWERAINQQWEKEQMEEDAYVNRDNGETVLNRYTVEFSDRKKTFHVNAIDPHDAVTIAAGKRLYSACSVSRDVNRENVAVSWVYQCNIKDGPKIRGSTPCRESRAYVNLKQ